MEAEIQLTLRRSGHPDRVFGIARGIYTVGSDKDNNIVLPGSDISWRHAALAFAADAAFVEDLASETGTFVDGRRVVARQTLPPGVPLRIGSFELSYALPERAPLPRPEAAAEPTIHIPEPEPEPPAPPPEPPKVFTKHHAQQAAADPQKEARRTVKRQIQAELLKRMDLKRLTARHIGEQDLRDRVLKTVREIVHDVRARLPPGIQAEDLTKEVFDEAVGLGPLEDLLEDDEVTEIMVNGPDQVYIERAGKLHLAAKTFTDNDSVLAVIERIVSPIGRRIDESQPYVDARLPDGSRVNAIIHPLSLVGPCLTIRKFSREPFKVSDLIGFATMTSEMAEFIRACVELRKNLVISGGTGSGKTTLLNVVSNFIPGDERIVTIEDAAELRLGQVHVIRLEARPPNIEGRGAITIRDLVRNALRMRPDRIVVGECRGGEALDMLQAMNTGHEGSLTTVHANSPRDVISRLETMVLMSGMELPVRAIREQIGAAIHVIVHTARMSDGSRKVVRVTEVVGLEGDQITMQDLFVYRQSGVDGHGKVSGRFEPTGSVPTFIDEMAARGVKIDRRMFDPTQWKH
jgi:pilus assembly protein CpaF